MFHTCWMALRLLNAIYAQSTSAKAKKDTPIDPKNPDTSIIEMDTLGQLLEMYVKLAELLWRLIEVFMQG
jgi:hypothetical protein